MKDILLKLFEVEHVVYKTSLETVAVKNKPYFDACFANHMLNLQKIIFS